MKKIISMILTISICVSNLIVPISVSAKEKIQSSKAYLKVLENYREKKQEYIISGAKQEVIIESQYTLYDIDKNGIPELIIDDANSMTGVYDVYTLKNGNVEMCGQLYAYYGLYDYAMGNGVVVSDGGIGSDRQQNLSLYSLDNGIITCKEELGEYYYKTDAAELKSELDKYKKIENFVSTKDSSLFAEIDTGSDERILNGDFSEYAGIYTLPDGTITELLTNGSTKNNMWVDGVENRVEDITKEDNGSYMWSCSAYVNGEWVDGVVCVLFPKNVEVVAWDGSVLYTDTTKPRFWCGNDIICDADYIYTKQDETEDELSGLPESVEFVYGEYNDTCFTINKPNVKLESDHPEIIGFGEGLWADSTEVDETEFDIIIKSPGKATVTAIDEEGNKLVCKVTITGVKIMLNDEELNFDQRPINQNGNLLVPIRKIAESMGKTVLWSDKANTAFIDNTDNALLIPIGETTLYLGNEEPYSEWETVKTNIPSQVRNGRTLVPIRQFAEALGAEVEWIGEYNTAIISYDNVESQAMSDSLFDAINLRYYVEHNNNNPFTWYTDNIIEPFYDSRNSKLDSVTMGISTPWSVITDLWKELYGDTNASIIIQETLYDILSQMPEDKSYEVDLSLLKDIEKYTKNGLKLFKETEGFDADFLKKHKNIKYLNDSTLKIAKNDNTGKVFDYLDWSMFAVEEVAYLLSDYSVNVSYLDVLEQAFDEQGILDYDMQEAINDLRTQYSDKYLGVVMDIQEEIIKNGFGTVMESITGAGYSLGKFIWGEMFSLTGVNKKGDALKTFYGLYCYNMALDREFNDVVIAEKKDKDLNYIKALIDIQTATKITAIDSISDMANWWAKNKVNTSADEFKRELSSWSYYTWKR